MDILGGLNQVGQGRYADEAVVKSAIPRSLREQLQDQLLYHQGKCKRIQAAMDALTPDVEKVLDALQKLQY